MPSMWKEISELSLLSDLEQPRQQSVDELLVEQSTGLSLPIEVKNTIIHRCWISSAPTGNTRATGISTLRDVLLIVMEL